MWIYAGIWRYLRIDGFIYLWILLVRFRCGLIAKLDGMQPSSFTIELPEHLADGKWEYWHQWFTDKGATVEAQGGRTYRIVCTRNSQLAYVGWAVFHTALASMCTVVATSGLAKPHASDYPKPSNP